MFMGNHMCLSRYLRVNAYPNEGMRYSTWLHGVGGSEDRQVYPIFRTIADKLNATLLTGLWEIMCVYPDI